jgi:hypothetical protein
MGKTTEAAFKAVEDEILSNRSSTMTAAVCVKPAGPDEKGFSHVAQYNFAEWRHVEQVLIQVMSDEYKGLANVPPHATVIFAANWSPCRKCTDQVIPDLAGRQLTTQLIKFRFNKYATKANWKSCKFKHWDSDGANYWDSEQEAENKYTQLMSMFGCIPWQKAVHVETGQEIVEHRFRVAIGLRGRSQALLEYR